ncbi:MAG: hypothetical protein ACE5JB_14900 [bacterium]
MNKMDAMTYIFERMELESRIVTWRFTDVSAPHDLHLMTEVA